MRYFQSRMQRGLQNLLIGKFICKGKQCFQQQQNILTNPQSKLLLVPFSLQTYQSSQSVKLRENHENQQQHCFNVFFLFVHHISTSTLLDSLHLVKVAVQNNTFLSIIHSIRSDVTDGGLFRQLSINNSIKVIKIQEPTSTQFSQPQQPKKQAPAAAPPPTSKLNKNFFERTRTTIFMLLGFMAILAAGQLYTSLFILFLNFMVFMEINSLKRNQQKQVNIPLTKYINWYTYFCFNYYALGVLILAKFPILGLWYTPINFLLTYHQVICSWLAISVFIGFVFSLKQGYLKYQFRLFGWIIMAIFLAIYQSWFLIHTTFEGMFFYIVPSLLIIVNDIFAYIFGYFFGKTPLIALSPKKTWEGYIGGAVSTFFFTFILTSALSQIPGITCPMVQPTLMPFTLPKCHEVLLESTNLGFLPFSITRLSLHVMVIGLFASLIGPFGGFFASGLKRSIKIKDFANLIPGHGGVTDRMDCQVIIGTFVYFYLHSFIRVSTNTVWYWVNTMSTQQKIAFYNALTQSFERYGVTPDLIKAH